MFRVDQQVEIRRSPDDVFDFIADVRNEVSRLQLESVLDSMLCARDRGFHA